MTISEFQKLIEDIYYERDSSRGLDGTFMWFMEEVGELAAALKTASKKELEQEFADCLAWLNTLASISGVKMDKAIGKYTNGCPGCRQTPCSCPQTKP